MIIFRPHRSSLDETMKEAKEFDDVEKKNILLNFGIENGMVLKNYLLLMIL